MDINQALGMAQRLKNHFRVFEEIHEFMKEVTALKGWFNEVESHKAAIEDEVRALRDEKARLSEEIEAMEPIAEEARKAQEHLDGLRAEINAIKEKLG